MTEPTELDIETEVVRMRREKLSRDLAANHGVTLGEAQRAILRAAGVPENDLAARLVNDDTALD